MTATQIELPDAKRFCFIGAGDPIKSFLEHFAAANDDHYALVITDPGLDEAWSNHISEPIGELCARLNLEVTLADPADPDVIPNLAREHRLDAAFVFGWRIFRKAFFQAFDERVFNYHPSDLPRFRGAGGFTWQVMHGVERICVTIHQMTSKVDAGAILLQDRRSLEVVETDPAAFAEALFGLYSEQTFDRLARILVTETTLELTPQDEFAATYFPMLLTDRNGLIDFSWDARSVVRFVRAFSEPYPGASFCYEDERYFATSCDLLSKDDDIHPFCHGLIGNVTGEAVHVMVNGGIIAMKDIKDENANLVPASAFRIGNRVYNRPDELLAAKLFRPQT